MAMYWEFWQILALQEIIRDNPFEVDGNILLAATRKVEIT